MTEKILPPGMGKEELSLFGERPRRDPLEELASWALERIQLNKPSAFELRLSVNGNAGQLIHRYDVGHVKDSVSAWATDVYAKANEDKERTGVAQKYQVMALGPSARSCGRLSLDMQDEADSLEGLSKTSTGIPDEARAVLGAYLRFGTGLGQFAANTLASQQRAIEQREEMCLRREEAWFKREKSYLERIDALEQKLASLSAANLEGMRAAWEATSTGEARKIELAMGMERQGKFFEFLPFLLKQFGHRKEDAAFRDAVASMPTEAFGALLSMLPAEHQAPALNWYKGVRQEAAENAASKAKAKGATPAPAAAPAKDLEVNGPLNTEGK